MVGVGDGPWDLMKQFDDELPDRTFDNFQFVQYESAWKGNTQEEKIAHFAMHCLQEIPEQYLFLKNSPKHCLA
jgi:E3 ubiquitin-protein ligase RGLG